MKYLREFATQADYEAVVAAGLAKPNVSLINEPFGVEYHAKKTLLGVFIQHIDGTLYTTADWTSAGFVKNDANGVAVITEAAEFVVSRWANSKLRWASNTSSLVEGILTSEDAEVAKTDLNGKRNTELMLAIDTAGAGYACTNDPLFPNGQKGYLPSLGEWEVFRANMAEINAALVIAGNKVYEDEVIWTSTQASNNMAWYVRLDTAEPKTDTKSNFRASRAFAPLNL